VTQNGITKWNYCRYLHNLYTPALEQILEEVKYHKSLLQLLAAGLFVNVNMSNYHVIFDFIMPFHLFAHYQFEIMY
jgi:hypothetical protein